MVALVYSQAGVRSKVLSAMITELILIIVALIVVFAIIWVSDEIGKD